MVTDALNEIYRWAKKNLNQPVLLAYWLDKVNGQLAGKVGLLLRQPEERLAGAEIEIDYFPERALPYLASCSALPLWLNQPLPQPPRVTLATQQEVIDWIKTGQASRSFD